ncbi:CLUMA_CG003080, isoform A [Clunio marinus]|uniref:CLUMA_CG003080, isoform A n=1 Tax=Clunio marinus TaxID=568069 RepID=A0A1J1HT01_9DIPT|nr:CLUMA_CG003080, isoform A [Clunio marinus]
MGRGRYSRIKGKKAKSAKYVDFSDSNPEEPSHDNSGYQVEDEFLDASNETVPPEHNEPYVDSEDNALSQYLPQRDQFQDQSNFSDTSSLTSKRSFDQIASPNSDVQANQKLQIVEKLTHNEDSSSREDLATGFKGLCVNVKDFLGLDSDLQLSESEMNRLNRQIQAYTGRPNINVLLASIQKDKMEATSSNSPTQLTPEGNSYSNPTEVNNGAHSSSASTQIAANTPVVSEVNNNIYSPSTSQTSGLKRNWNTNQSRDLPTPPPPTLRPSQGSPNVSRFKDQGIVENDGTVFVAYYPESYPENIISYADKNKIMNQMSNQYKDGRDEMKKRKIAQVEIQATSGILLMKEKNVKGAGWNELLFKQQNWTKILGYNLLCVPARDISVSPAFMLIVPRTDLNWKDIVLNIRNSNKKVFSTKDWKLTVALDDKGFANGPKKFLFISNGNLINFMNDKKSIKINFPPFNPATIRKMHHGGNNPLIYASNIGSKTDTEEAEEKWEKNKRLVEEFDRDFGGDEQEESMEDSDSD